LDVAKQNPVQKIVIIYKARLKLFLDFFFFQSGALLDVAEQNSVKKQEIEIFD
jgi:hypothetical protein